MFHTSAAAAASALALFASLAAVLACAQPPERPTHDQQAGKPDLVVANASSDLKHTQVVAQFQAPIAEGKSLLWCSTMQLAWNELSTLVTGGNGTPSLGDHPSTLAKDLLVGRGSAADLDAGSFVALAGMGPDTIAQIKDRLDKTFGGSASPKLLPTNLAPGEILAYAYLFKNLQFPTPFIRSKGPISWGSTKLNTWGCWSDDLVTNLSDIRKQVKILAYASRTEWSVELTTSSDQDRFIISRLTPGATLEATSDAALAMGKGSEPASMSLRDELRVPYLNFDITESFADLVGTHISGSKTAGTIDAAIQNIRFKLDERGAVLKSEAAMTVTSAPFIRDEPKIMVCDGPFLIQMIRKDATTPYFVAWVANPEILTKN
jgi:hypothetical protein